MDILALRTSTKITNGIGGKNFKYKATQTVLINDVRHFITGYGRTKIDAVSELTSDLVHLIDKLNGDK